MYMEMKEVTFEDYLRFIEERDTVTVGGVDIKLSRGQRVGECNPSEFSLERSTVWSFPSRGKWATHKGDYRGNWSPYIPRNLILRYTSEGDWVLDQMMGSGTTLVEAKLLGRNAIGVDVNLEAVMLARDRLNFDCDSQGTVKTFVGDARYLDKIGDNTIDLVATHPPYANIVSYTKKGTTDEDISRLPFKRYLEAIRDVAREAFRVLKPGKHCAILIGDTRKRKHYVPLAFMVMKVFLDVGFILKEDIIKLQWNMMGTRRRWLRGDHDFLLINHEHVFVFRKPESEDELKRYRFSTSEVFEWLG